MEPVVQLSLPLFGHLTFENLLQRRGAQGKLSVIANPRLKRRWQVNILPFSGKRQLIIPSYLNEAPEEIKTCLIEWALLPVRPRRSNKKAVRKQRTILEETIGSYIESLPEAPSRISRFNPANVRNDARGRRYDLQEVFNVLNLDYFNGSVHALVRWGHAGSKTSYHATRTDITGQRFNLITIAGAYNHRKVPRFAIEGIMHHEMLHIAVPPYTHNGRAVIHGKEFRNEENKFRWHHEWKRWEREELPRLLRSADRIGL